MYSFYVTKMFSLLKRFPENEILKEFFRRLGYFSDKEEHVMVDVGAQFGNWSKIFANDNWRVIAFEAFPENYMLMEGDVAKKICIMYIK